MSCLQGLPKTYTWDEAKAICQNLNWGELKWDLPTISELFRLLNCTDGTERSKLLSRKECLRKMPKKEHKACSQVVKVCKAGTGNVSAYTNSVQFPGTPRQGFWSSSADRRAKEKAWGMNYSLGESQTTDKSNRLYIRCISRNANLDSID